ncbi:MNIO family bufferin maturase [Novosphingobium taihuense]|uniref:Uncharacterized protein n=1 Tax=Novosphingobium taihuense TaxID=260085 RepID=A0A7W7AA14_9SPHN|nr:DUF692 domain-containing protein [Novosphingobium taihuense]MBB4613012.1 hypothetical protein [Novosphingobium taihuense]TWH85156.1 hypothetical protein IQ25_01910 [Novosphingobium taihuense]
MTSSLSGFGLGMRREHYAAYVDGSAKVDFIEVISENFMVEGGRPLDTLFKARSNYPLALHGVSLSVGSADGVRSDYLERLRQLVDLMEPAVVSDHLCWTRIGNFNSHDLLPLPMTEEALQVVCANIGRAQDALGRAMLFENPSSYIAFPGAMTEWEFLAEMVSRTGCRLLLDVNNIHVSATNHGFDPIAYLDGVPWRAVGQVHLAGHSVGQTMLIDTHDQPVPECVWQLYAAALRRAGDLPTMIERDDNIPDLAELIGELDTARELHAETLAFEAAA